MNPDPLTVPEDDLPDTTDYATRRRSLRRQSGLLAVATLLALAIGAVYVAVIR